MRITEEGCCVDVGTMSSSLENKRIRLSEGTAEGDGEALKEMMSEGRPEEIKTDVVIEEAESSHAGPSSEKPHEVDSCIKIEPEEESSCSSSTKTEPQESDSSTKIKTEPQEEADSSAKTGSQGSSQIDDYAKPTANTGGKKIIQLNPFVLHNMLKPPLNMKTSSSDKVEGSGEPSQKSDPSKMEFLKLSQSFTALASALKSEPKKKVFCANTNCNWKTDTVIDAPSFARLYFGMSGGGTPKICSTCMKKAEQFHQKSKLRVLHKENLFDLKFEIQTASSDAVVDLDSPVNSPLPDNTSDKEDGDGDGRESYSISVKKLNSILDTTMRKFDLKLQLEKCTERANEEADDLDSKFKEMDLQLDTLRNRIDSTTRLYNENIAVRAKAIEIGCVDIDLRGIVTATTNENLETDGLTRLGTKALNKALDGLKNIGTGAELSPAAGLAPVVSTNRMLIFSKPKDGQEVYAMHKHSLCYWLPARIIKSVTSPSENRPTIYTVMFAQRIRPRGRSPNEDDCYVKEVTGKQLAFKKPSPLTLPIGSRIIAKFKDLINPKSDVEGMLYAGIIAELPKSINNYRYLVFFDDGYAQYVQRHEVFPVVDSSAEVWLDVHKNSQDFVHDYVTKYPDRHMIRAQIGSTFNVELNGRWLHARIEDVDGSLMKVQYLRTTDGVEFEWIYRGSTRLGPLFSRLNMLEAKSKQTVARRHTYHRTNPNFSFELNTDNDDSPKVAKKHTGADGLRPGPRPVLRATNGMIVSTDAESEGNMIKIQIPQTCPSPRPYVNHHCSEQCAYKYEEDNYRRVSPLAIPFYLGWARELAGPNRDTVYYHTPCGVRCESYAAIHKYITVTGAEIPIDYFSMESNIDCLNEFEPSRRIEYLKDISYGKEWTPVPCINSLDHDLPAYMEYITARQCGKGVEINNDDGFLTCCDCTDDCQDKSKCACFQMTLAGDAYVMAKKEGEELDSYENRRLKQHVFSGIYECNRKCKCRSTCFNRVVQNKVKWPIQIFKTVAKGWGVRALHDMPQGSFICVYTGQLLTDAIANQEGRLCGDEYLAELDFIECNETSKEEYESDCTDIESEEPGTRSKERLERNKGLTNGTGTEPEKKKYVVAKKSTCPVPVFKAVKSTGGTKRKDDSFNRPVARKSGSKGGMNASRDELRQSKSSPTSSDVPSPSSSTLSKRSSKDDSDSDEDESDIRAYSSFSASQAAKGAKNAPRLSLREYFGKDEAVYIMDAKSMGNFGRYLNHSCDPNVFVQNLFVDTHDARFPWVAFFTKKDVKAGTELTWDYAYEIGSVDDKTLYCYCLQPGCRGRLL